MENIAQELLTPKEVAKKLKVTEEQVRLLIRKGKIRALNLGTGLKRPLYRISQQTLDSFLGKEYTPQAPCIRSFRQLDPVPDLFPSLK
jgi:excisionase family DNA binding protein